MADSDLIPILLAQAWQITLLIVSVAGINRWLSRKRPHLAHALWLVVLVKCVTPPMWSSPSGMFCWLQAPRVVEQEDFRFPVDAPAGSFVRLSDLVPDQTDVIERMEKSLSETDITFGEPLSELADDEFDQQPSVLTTPTRSWSSLLLGAWLLMSLGVIGVAVVRFLSCWRLLKKSPQRECPELNELLSDLAKRLRLRRRVRLIVTESRLGPAVIGLFRSTVLPPALIVDRLVSSHHAERDGYFALAPILAHELLHIRRGDLWVGLLQTLAQAVWWVNRLTTREAERCCDEEVLAELGCDPAAYARALVDVLELKRKLKPVPVFPGVRPVEVTSQRLERIMELGQGCRRRTPWWCWLLAALAAAVTWPGAAFVVTADDAKKTETTKRVNESQSEIRGANSDAINEGPSLQIRNLVITGNQVGRDFDIVSTEPFANPQPTPKDTAAPRGRQQNHRLEQPHRDRLGHAPADAHARHLHRQRDTQSFDQRHDRFRQDLNRATPTPNADRSAEQPQAEQSDSAQPHADDPWLERTQRVLPSELLRGRVCDFSEFAGITL